MADKSKKQQYLDAIKTMTPGAVLEFVSQQLDVNPVKFLAKNAGWLALAAAKNGWVKASEIKDAVKNFGNKNKEDNTGIDFENAEVDEDTMKFMCLLDGDAMKKLDEFVKNYYDSIKDIGKEMKDADDKLEKDAKSKKIDLKPDEIKANGLEVAKVIDSKNNKDKSGKELTDEIKEQIDRKKQEDELEQKKKEMAKLLANVDKDELDKIIKAVYKDNKPKKESIQHRKRGKLILAEAALPTFSCGGHSSLVDDQAIKNAAYAIGKTVKNKEEAMAKFTEWLKDAAANRGPNGTFSALDSKDIERTLSNGTPVLKNLQDYAAQVFDNPDAISDQVSQKIIDSAVDGSVDPSEFGVDFVAKSDASFDKLIHAMQDLDSSDPKKIEAAGNTIKKFREFASNFPKDDPFYLNACKGAEAMYAAKTGNVLDGSTAPKDLIEKAKKFKGSLSKFADNMEKGFDADGIEERAKAATEAAGAAEAASAGAGDSAMEKLMADVKINGNKLQNFNSSGIYHQACKSLGVDDKDMASIFSRSSSSNSIKFAKDKLMLNMQAFVVNYEKDPDKAIQTAMAGLKGNQKDALAEILCKMKPEAAEKFKDIGIDVNGKLDDIADTTDAADVTTKTISKSAMADMGFTEGKAPGDDFVKCPFPVDSEGNGFIASDMAKRLNNLEDIFDDGKMDATEYKEYMRLQAQMIEYNTWAMAHADSADPNIQAKVKQIFELNNKLNQFELDNYEELDDAVNERVGAVKGAKPNMAASDETKEELKKKTGMKMFTGLGWARLAARTTGYVLNHGKDLVNALGAKAIKKKEDNGVIAEITVLLTNGEGSDTKFSDTKFSVRFNINDMKWHATNLDDRKMKFPEDVVIKKILDTNTGKKFKAACLKKWSNVFDPKDKSKKIVSDILSNPKKNGMKLDGDTEKFIDMVSKIGSNFDSIKKQFS